MTSQPLYMKPHPVCRVTYTLYMRHHNHYLCHHTHSFDDVTPFLCMTSHPYMYNIIYPIKASHHVRYDITFTVFMTSLPLFLNTSFTVSLSSRPVYQLQHTHSLYYIAHSMYDITFSMHVITQILYDITAI